MMDTMKELNPTVGKYFQDTQGDEKLSPKKGKLNPSYVVLGFYGGFLQCHNTKKLIHIIYLFNSFKKSSTVNAHLQMHEGNKHRYSKKVFYF